MKSCRFAWSLLMILSLCSVTAGAETLRIEGLKEPVEILIDDWGIAHIYAGNEHDLFFAQGFNAARDRLFQLELWRRQATGTVAEILGRKELDRDIERRLQRVDRIQHEMQPAPLTDRLKARGLI